MKNCIGCKQELSEDAKFCTVCGHSQLEDPRIESRGIFVLFYIVSALSILDGISIIGRGLFYELVFTHFENGYFRGWFYAIAGIGMIVGASKMLIQKKKNGLYVYSISQLVYIATVIRAVFWYTDNELASEIASIANGVGALFIVPALIYTLIFWFLSKRILK